MSYTNGLDDPSAFFQTVLYSGDNANTKAITFDGNSDLDLSSGGLWWGKTRSTARNHQLIDSIRGVTKALQSNVSNAELSSDSSGFLASFNSNGFTTQKGSYDNGNVNMSGRTYVNWCWKAGTSFTNDASGTGIGSLDSSGTVNETAGFAIVKYTGNGSSGATIKHGLSTAPTFMMIRVYNASAGFQVYSKAIGATKFVYLNTTEAVGTSAGAWNNTAPTSSIFTVGNGGNTNNNGGLHIAYIFSERQGYSKFGSYIGNGNADGTFVYTGFKPAFIMIKRTDTAADWEMYDNKRLGFNDDNPPLYANLNNAEGSNDRIDILSNGWKIRASSGNLGADGGTYIYMAFSSSPFTTSTGIPTTAR